MPKMIVSLDGVVIKEFELTKDRTTLGRRPYNDVVIDNLAISGEHLLLLRNGPQVQIEDLNSTNGTFVNGKAVKLQALAHGDLIEVGKYKVKFLQDNPDAGFEKTMVYRPGALPQAGGANSATPTPAAMPPIAAAPAVPGAIHVLNGAAAGREMKLVKVVTTLGKPGVAVAAITQRGAAYTLSMVDGQSAPQLNGQTIGPEPVILRHGDTIELAGTQMRFVQG